MKIRRIGTLTTSLLSLFLTGLILSETIKDDNSNSMFYCVRGFYSDYPHTEVFICDSSYVSDFLEKLG